MYTAATEIPDLERQITQEENAISILLGKNPGDIPRGLKAHRAAARARGSGRTSLRSFWNGVPIFVQAEQNLVAANAQIGVATCGVLSADFADRQRRI